MTIAPDDGKALVGDSAEWIVENPPAVVGTNGVQNIMAAYGTIDFSENDVFVTDSSGKGVDLWPGGYTDTSCGGAWPLGFSPAQFSFYNMALQPGPPYYGPGALISVAQPTTVNSNPSGLPFTYCGPGSGLKGCPGRATIPIGPVKPVP